MSRQSTPSSIRSPGSFSERLPSSRFHLSVGKNLKIWISYQYGRHRASKYFWDCFNVFQSDVIFMKHFEPWSKKDATLARGRINTQVARCLNSRFDIFITMRQFVKLVSALTTLCTRIFSANARGTRVLLDSSWWKDGYKGFFLSKISRQWRCPTQALNIENLELPHMICTNTAQLDTMGRLRTSERVTSRIGSSARILSTLRTIHT